MDKDNIDYKAYNNLKYEILLNSVMNYANNILAPKYNDIIALQTDVCVEEYRFLAIIWLKGVCKTFRLSSETRDTGIQILDNYLSKSLHDDPSTKTKHNVSLACISSILLSAKMHEAHTHNFLSMKNFADFDMNELIPYQSFFLQKLNWEIYVNATPTACIQIFLGLWDCDEELKETLIATADIFVADFYCARRSMLFAPSTIAICALIISFSTLRMDCTPWLDCVPDICFRKTVGTESNSNNFGAESNLLLDIDKCLDIFQRIERVHRNSKCNVGSPTSITFNSENMETVNESTVKFCYNNDFQNTDNELPCGLGQIDLQSIENDCSPRLVLNNNI